MNQILLEKKYKKQFLELKYLYAELEYYEDVLKEAQKNFKVSFYERATEKSLNVKKPEEKKDTDIQSTDIGIYIEDKIKIKENLTNNKNEDLSKLYKKIASITHPDTISKNEKEELRKKRLEQFLEAQEAYRNRNWYVLSMIAMDLGLELPKPNKEQIKWLDDEAKRIRERIDFIKTTYAWVWYNEEDDKKNNIMDRYLSLVVK
jgi:hypothetical protein